MENQFVIFNQKLQKYFVKIKGRRFCWSKYLKNAFVFKDYEGASWIAISTFSDLLDYNAGMVK